MKDIREELKNLGDALATSLGFAVIAVGIGIAIVIVMHSIYCQPPEEGRKRSSSGEAHGHGIAMQLITNPVHKWHPLNVYHR